MGLLEPVTLDEDFIKDPHTVLARLRAEEPVRPTIMPHGLRVWLVTGYAEARKLLADPRISKDNKRLRELVNVTSTGVAVSAPLSASLAAHMLNSDPPSHTRLRTLVNKAFTPRAVARLRPRIEQIADELLGDIMAGTVDLLKTFAFPLPITVICELLGVPAADHDKFRAWSTTIVSSVTPERLQEDSAALAAYLAELVAAKRANPAEDLLSDLTQVSEAGDQLSEVELISTAFLLLVAGHETTVNLLGNGVLALLRQPDQLAALRADPTLLPGAIEEFLRFEGPINIATLRFTTAPLPVGDVEIPAGEFVMVSLLGANRDGDRFTEPDRLDLTRPATGHLAFGHGIHYCVGAPLARLEAEIGLGKLLARFSRLELAAEPAELRWRDSTLIRGLESLPVRVG